MIKVYGSSLCPDCTAFQKELNKDQIPYEFIDITASMPNLKAFLKLRDHDPVFASAKETGSVGIPAIVQENGEITLDWQAVIREAGFEPSAPAVSGSSCSLDHKGNC